MPRAGNVTPMEIEDGDLGTVSGIATYNLTNFDDLGGGIIFVISAILLASLLHKLMQIWAGPCFITEIIPLCIIKPLALFFFSFFLFFLG